MHEFDRICMTFSLERLICSIGVYFSRLFFLVPLSIPEIMSFISICSVYPELSSMSIDLN
jgi:hypothetical protein